MKKIGDSRRFETDPIEVKRTQFLVTAEDVGKTQKGYLGQDPYTFVESDVGRLIEVTQYFSPGALSWRFGSIFKDLRMQYPDPKPYIGIQE